MAAAIPAIELANYAHPAGIGRPHGEPGALDRARAIVRLHQVRTQRFVGPQVRALAEEVDVLLAQCSAEGVGVRVTPLRPSPQVMRKR